MATKRVVLRGRVQGVGFRYFVLQGARELDVRGTVRNRTDGSVEAFLQADEESRVESLIDRMREGPPAARVDSVDAESVEEPATEYDGMRIVR